MEVFGLQKRWKIGSMEVAKTVNTVLLPTFLFSGFLPQTLKFVS